MDFLDACTGILAGNIVLSYDGTDTITFNMKTYDPATAQPVGNGYTGTMTKEQLQAMLTKVQGMLTQALAQPNVPVYGS